MRLAGRSRPQPLDPPPPWPSIAGAWFATPGPGFDRADVVVSGQHLHWCNFPPNNTADPWTDRYPTKTVWNAGMPPRHIPDAQHRPPPRSPTKCLPQPDARAG